jgi:hypothetical protein
VLCGRVAQGSGSRVGWQNIVYLTVNLPDIDESTLKFDLGATALKFEAKTGKCVASPLPSPPPPSSA